MTSDQINDLQAIRRALFNGQKSAAKTEAQAAFVRIAKRITDIDLLDTWCDVNDGAVTVRCFGGHWTVALSAHDASRMFSGTGDNATESRHECAAAAIRVATGWSR